MEHPKAIIPVDCQTRAVICDSEGIAYHKGLRPFPVTAGKPCSTYPDIVALIGILGVVVIIAFGAVLIPYRQEIPVWTFDYAGGMHMAVARFVGIEYEVCFVHDSP
jgi:hypothetical protein